MGPKAELDSTAVSQPAMFVSSMAAVEKLRAESAAAGVKANEEEASLRSKLAEAKTKITMGEANADKLKAAEGEL